MCALLFPVATIIEAEEPPLFHTQLSFDASCDVRYHSVISKVPRCGYGLEN